MSIQLVTYANQTVTPTNDAIIYERAVGQNGIFNGCTVTVSGNSVNITGGYGLICGREFEIEAESITITLSGSGTILGRLYVRLDLADADTPIQLLTSTGETLPALQQDSDVNYTNGVYEMELATFDVGVSSLSNVVETYHTIEDAYMNYEVGTNGNWTYRKGKDGTLECWYEGNPGSYTINTARGSMYSGGYISFTFPVQFYGTPTITVGAALTTDNYVVSAQMSEVANSGLKVRIVSGSSISSNSGYTIHIHAIGKWQ